jgi:hypothetical protein
MAIRESINSKSRDELRAALETFLSGYTQPAFGALPKSEVDLLVLRLLESLDYISEEPEVYELVSKLRVTRTKARNLIYERELRRSSEADLDEKVKQLLKRPLLQKAGEQFVLEVENPLVSDHLKAKLKKLNHITDGSFSPSIIKLELDAVIALMQSYLTEPEQRGVRGALIAAGAPDGSFKGVIKATLNKLASKIADKSGEAMVEKITGTMSPIIDAAIDQISTSTQSLFEED